MSELCARANSTSPGEAGFEENAYAYAVPMQSELARISELSEPSGRTHERLAALLGGCWTSRRIAAQRKVKTRCHGSSGKFQDREVKRFGMAGWQLRLWESPEVT